MEFTRVQFVIPDFDEARGLFTRMPSNPRLKLGRFSFFFFI